MTKYVRIKKAKNLRFRLISVLYLLFISLSIIQIPIEWLRINPTMTSYLESTTSKDIVVPQIKTTLDFLDDLEAKFNEKIGLNSTDGKYREPTGYSATDNVFIVNKMGDQLFEKLVDLKNYFRQLPAKNPKRAEFDRLFSADLANGLENNKPIIWNEWKFKHVPVAVVKVLLAEMRLRLNLLNGAIELDTKGKQAEKVVLMAYNMDLLKLGDTATFVVSKFKNLKFAFEIGGSSVNEYAKKGDTLYFVPKQVGQYVATFTAEGITEKMNITVAPAGFKKVNTDVIQSFFLGRKAKVEFINLMGETSLTCNCASNVIKTNSSIEFTPNSEGWCDVAITSSTGQLLLRDSVFVQGLPTPYILVAGTSGNKISYKRLLQSKSVAIQAIHPDMHNFNYDITKVSYTLVGVSTDAKTTSGSKIELSENEISKLKYIVINSVELNTTVKQLTIKEPILIEIIKS